jgi:hypothetical protein
MELTIREVARMGGTETLRRYGREYFRNLARLRVEAQRKAKAERETKHEEEETQK